MVFIPVHDKNALRFIPFQRVTVGLIVVNVLVYLWQMSLSPEGFVEVTLGAGVIPSTLFGEAVLAPGIAALPPEATLLSHMFLHGSWLHLISNMVFLWVFGDNVEDAMGHTRFLVFYLLCGMMAGYAHALSEPFSDTPMIGASGATSGIIGAYLLLYPKVKVWILVLMRLPLRLPAYLVLVFWVAFQAYFIISGTQPGTAWWAHMGGFACGAFLILFLRRKGVPLFGPHISPEETNETQKAS